MKMDPLAEKKKQPKSPSEKRETSVIKLLATASTTGNLVKELCREVPGTKRNVTVDNYFASIPLFENMLLENVTMVGTLPENKKEIPPSFLWKKEKGSGVFAFDKTKVLVSYAQTEKRDVLMVCFTTKPSVLEPRNLEGHG